MKKSLNTAGVMHEMREQSVHFRQTQPAAAEPISTAFPENAASSSGVMPTAETERFSERKSERTEMRSEIRSEGLPVKRLSRRYSFEFYDDQILTLKRLKHEAEMRGEKVTLSDIVRVALDRYLNDGVG